MELLDEIKRIANSYGIDSDEWCKGELQKWEYYNSWSDNFKFENFIREDCRAEREFTRHYGMSHDEVIRKIRANHRLRYEKVSNEKKN